MTTRIALANSRFPKSPEESVQLAGDAIAEAGRQGADIVCFPECFVPGYRLMGKSIPPADAAFLERAWARVASAAANARVAVILGTERIDGGKLLATALVIDQDGAIAGFQDKVQIDPSEEGTYANGSGRRIFQTGPLTFGIAKALLRFRVMKFLCHAETIVDLLRRQSEFSFLDIQLFQARFRFQLRQEGLSASRVNDSDDGE